jgi:hypothetical protein
VFDRWIENQYVFIAGYESINRELTN